MAAGVYLGSRLRRINLDRAVAISGNIMAGGLIGWGVDASSGAQYNLPPHSVQLDPTADVTTHLADDRATSVTTLRQLDQLHEAKQLPNDGYSRD
jgi:hypothetical protein